MSRWLKPFQTPFLRITGPKFVTLALVLGLLVVDAASPASAQGGTSGPANEAAIREAMYTQDRQGRSTGRRVESRISDIRVAEKWATCGYEEGDRNDTYEGAAILRCVGGRWRVVTSGGGSMGDVLFRYGVPRELWKRLVTSSVLVEANERAAAVGLLRVSAARALTDSDLLGLTARQLTLARNEIFARHGRPFRDPELSRYFRSQEWYLADDYYSEDRLTPLELQNTRFIAGFQKRRGLNW